MFASTDRERRIPSGCIFFATIWGIAVGWSLFLGLTLVHRIPLPPKPTAWKTISLTGTHAQVSIPNEWESGSLSIGGVVSGYITGKSNLYGVVLVSGSAVSDAMDFVRKLPPAQAAAKLHKMFRKLFLPKDLNDYEESAGQPCTIAGMPACYSDFTARCKVALRMVKMRGWRITIIAGDAPIIVYAYAPESRWEQFKPYVEQILSTIRPAS